jgi:hypothetical protein
VRSTIALYNYLSYIPVPYTLSFQPGGLGVGSSNLPRSDQYFNNLASMRTRGATVTRQLGAPGRLARFASCCRGLLP